MSKIVFRLIAVLLMIAAAMPAAAAEPFNPNAMAASIAPLIDWHTYAIIRINVAKIDVDQAGKWLVQTAGAPIEAVAPIAESIKQWRDGFLAAGGREILIFRTTGAPLDAPPVLVVPLAPRIEAGKVATALRQPVIPNGPKDQGAFGLPGRIIQMRRFLIAAPNLMMARRLMTVTPDPRPELGDALAAAGDAAIQIVVMPSKDHRNLMLETSDTLPAPLPPMPMTVISQGMRWISVGVNLPEKMSVELTIQADDEQAAEALNELAGHALAMMAAQPWRREMIPRIDQVVGIITPELSGARLILQLDDRKINHLNKIALLPALQRSRQLAKQAVSMANLNGIGKALMIYGIDHDDRRPATLQVLVENKLIDPKNLISPLTGKAAYIYIRPAPGAPDTTVVAYEDPATHDMDKTAVLFHGNQVTMAPVDEKFRETVNQAKAQSTAAYGGKQE